MKLTELSDINRRVLLAMYTHGAMTRQHIAQVSGLSPQQASGGLTRLDSMGLVDPPDQPGQGWTITAKGRAMLFDALPKAGEPPAPEPEPGLDSESESEPEPDQEFEIESESGPEVVSNAIAAELLQAMEIEVSLDQVRTLLRAPKIPAQSSRVYREIVTALPKPLVDALAPITAWVDLNG